MKKNTLILAAFAAVAMITSCQKGETPKEPSPYITVQTAITGQTRVTAGETNQSFEATDQIRVMGWKATDFSGATISNAVVNSVNTFDGASTWTPEPMMLWADMTSQHLFSAIYPVLSVTDLSAQPYDLKTESVKDVLWAKNDGADLKGENGTPVALAFEHIMSKVKVNLTFRSEFGDNPQPSAVTVQALTDTKINLTTGAVAPEGTASEVALTKISETAYEGFFAPQGIQYVTITINGRNYVYDHMSYFSLMRGQIHTISLIVGKDKIELGSVSIGGWGQGSEITGGEAQ